MKNMKEMPESERPYEKCMAFGPRELSNAELIAIILRSGTPDRNVIELSQEVLSVSSLHGGLTGLYHTTPAELSQIRGIGQVKAVQLVCIAELARRMARESIPEKSCLNGPEQIAARYMEELRHEEQEIMILMMLDTRYRFLADRILFRGTVNHSIASPREIFVEALRHKAVHIVLLHNHPSGDISPSEDDLLFTSRIIEAGELVGIPLADHIIIGNNTYYSMKERGIIHEQ